MTKLNPTGTALAYSTYLGGNGDDAGVAIAVDTAESASAYVPGGTNSTNFPTTTGAAQTIFGGGTCRPPSPFPCPDAFVTKLEPSGTSLAYSTYLGGSSFDLGWAIAVDSAYNAYVVGGTNSLDFPTDASTGNFQGGTCSTGNVLNLSFSFNCPNAFLTEIDPTGSTRLFSTYLGGASGDFAFGVALDASGGVYMAGSTLSSNFPITAGALQTSMTGFADAFISKFGGSPAATPTFSIPSGRYTSPQSVTISDTTAGATIYYTTDGTTPTPASTPYTGAITVNSTETIAAMATANGYSASAVATATYTMLPIAGVSPSSLTFGNQNVGTTSGSQPVTLSNTGDAALTIASIAPSANFGESDNCAGSVAVSGSCTINVTFTPTSGGPVSGALTITDNSNGVAGSTQTVTLSGTGINPGAGLSATSEAFGSQVINTTSAAKTVTLTSTGTTSLGISSIAITGTNAGDFHETNACPATLAPAAKCTISLTYTPAILGAESASFTVTDNASTSPQKVTLTGTGIAPAYLSPTSEAFGSVAQGTASAAKIITLYNNASVAFNISSITTTNPDFAQTNTCNGSLAAKGHCAITVTFTPSIIGAETGTLTVSDAAYGSPQTAALTGTGIVPAYLSPTSEAFGNVGENSPSVVKTITLYNNEAVALAISSITLSNPDYAQTNTCGTSVAAKGNCAIKVTLTPTVLLADNGTLTVTDAAVGSPQTATLTGTGIVPAYLSPTSEAFGSVVENTASAVKTITLYNNEAVALSITSITTGNSDYTQTNTCGTSVAAKGNCAIKVTLTPTVLGADNATLTVNDAAFGSPQTAALTGTGLAQATASPTSLTFTAQTVGTTSAAKTVTLTNNLPTALTMGSLTFTGTNPTDFAQTNTCGTSVAAKGHCTISIKFTPGATLARSATLNINDSASNTPQTVLLTGTGK